MLPNPRPTPTPTPTPPPYPCRSTPTPGKNHHHELERNVRERERGLEHFGERERGDETLKREKEEDIFEGNKKYYIKFGTLLLCHHKFRMVL